MNTPAPNHYRSKKPITTRHYSPTHQNYPKYAICTADGYVSQTQPNNPIITKDKRKDTENIAIKKGQIFFLEDSLPLYWMQDESFSRFFEYITKAKALQLGCAAPVGNPHYPIEVISKEDTDMDNPESRLQGYSQLPNSIKVYLEGKLEFAWNLYFRPKSESKYTYNILDRATNCRLIIGDQWLPLPLAAVTGFNKMIQYAEGSSNNPEKITKFEIYTDIIEDKPNERHSFSSHLKDLIKNNFPNAEIVFNYKQPAGDATLSQG